jgi:RimJ/RimL family protein N-acetyltransferase
MLVYNEKIKELKNNPTVNFTKIFVDNNDIVLRVVDDSDETIELLTNWRNKFWDAFPVKFPATKDGTKKWLREQVYDKSDRILFLIILNDKKIGHIGTYRYNSIDNSAQIDNVLRSIRGSVPGLMEKVTTFMINWMFNDLHLSKVSLKVFSDNFKAINLYERCGMVTVGIIPLKQNFTADGWKWQETILKDDEYADRYFSIMEINKTIT